MMPVRPCFSCNFRLEKVYKYITCYCHIVHMQNNEKLIIISCGPECAIAFKKMVTNHLY